MPDCIAEIIIGHFMTEFLFKDLITSMWS